MKSPAEFPIQMEIQLRGNHQVPCDPANKKFLRPRLCKALHNIGRKNYLFAGSHQAAQRAAMLYSLLGTCKINNVNPYDWLRDVFERIPTHHISKIEELMPHNWAKNLSKS